MLRSARDSRTVIKNGASPRFLLECNVQSAEFRYSAPSAHKSNELDSGVKPQNESKRSAGCGKDAVRRRHMNSFIFLNYITLSLCHLLLSIKKRPRGGVFLPCRCVVTLFDDGLFIFPY